MSSLLVVDDDRSVRLLVTKACEGTEVQIIEAATAGEGLDLIRRSAPDVTLLDIQLPDLSGLELFNKIKAIDAKLPVIFITSSGDSDTAIEAMKLGAYDYVLKPFGLDELRELIEQAVVTRRRMRTPVAITQATTEPARGDLLIGRSPQMQEVYKAIGRVAAQETTVLIRGESGTGKELVARAIYQHSARADRGFLAINCAAIPEPLLESELFGHEKGSFTGAATRRIGKFEQCSDGTLFLDEVGDMSPVLQAKILRVLQEQRFERVGGTETIQTNVRIIAATHRNLEKMVATNEFRADLFYRLNGFTIFLPPLRDRHEDIGVLLEHLLARLSRELGKEVHGIAPDALEQLLAYPWPGNVRELQGVVRQALLQATGPVLVSEFLPGVILSGTAVVSPREVNSPEGTPLECFIDSRLENGSNDLYSETIERVERVLLTRVLQSTHGNQSQAAKILGITRGSLRHKIRLLGISIGQVVSVDYENDPILDPVNDAS